MGTFRFWMDFIQRKIIDQRIILLLLDCRLLALALNFFLLWYLFFQAGNNSHVLVVYEVALSVQKLVSKMSLELHLSSWDLLLDTLSKLFEHTGLSERFSQIHSSSVGLFSFWLLWHCILFWSCMNGDLFLYDGQNHAVFHFCPTIYLYTSDTLLSQEGNMNASLLQILCCSTAHFHD